MKKMFLDHQVKSDIRIYDNIRKIVTGQRDDYTSGCLLDYNYFNEDYQMIVIYLSRTTRT